jgi:outer membrane protein OmpA-like peptidoglycan-associated protein
MSPPAPEPPPGPHHRLTITPVPGKGMKIHISSDLLFDFDKRDLKPKALQTLMQVKTYIQESVARHDRFTLSVEGHTDSIGRAAYNMHLSVLRAESVKNWLVSENVMKASDVAIHGWGATRPVKPNKKPDGHDNPAGRAENRRVEIFVLYELVNLEP